jgi:hypothetical protein
VLRHRDTSPQNCLFESDRLAGLVDWENVSALGAPGFDVLNAAVAFLEHGVGLVRWSEDRVLQTFRAAWVEGRYGEGARAAAAESASGAGFPESLFGSLEIVFFGRRLGRRLASKSISTTGPETAAKMLELACAR